MDGLSAQDIEFTPRHLTRVQVLMKRFTGITLSDRKQQMIVNRLYRRLIVTRAPNFDR